MPDVTRSEVIIRGLREELAAALQREEQYQEIIDREGDLIFIISPQGELEFVNTSSDILMGVSLTEKIGKNVWEFLPIEITHKIRKSVNDALCSGDTVHTLEHEFRLGNERWIDFLYSPIIRADHQTRVMCVARDITESINTESFQLKEKLRAIEIRFAEMYYKVYQNSPNPILFLKNGKISEWNAATNDFFKFDKDVLMNGDLTLLSAKKQYRLEDVPERLQYYVSQATNGEQVRFSWVFSSVYGDIAADVSLVPQNFEKTQFVLLMIRFLKPLIHGKHHVSETLHPIRDVLLKEAELWNKIDTLVMNFDPGDPMRENMLDIISQAHMNTGNLFLFLQSNGFNMGDQVLLGTTDLEN